MPVDRRTFNKLVGFGATSALNPGLGVEDQQASAPQATAHQFHVAPFKILTMALVEYE